MNSIKNTLSKLDLTSKEIDVYLASIKIWTSASSGIIHLVDLPQSTVKYTLESLVKKNLMTKSQKGITTLFTPEHPSKLKNLLIIEKNKVENKEREVDKIMWDLLWIYNPYTKLPKVTFYEWLDGIEKVLNDSLNSTEIIDGFVNVDDIKGIANNVNKKYTEKRILKKIKRRSIYLESSKTKEYLKNIYKDESLNTIKYLDNSKYKLYISFMMYDWKISYITFKDDTYIWVIIQNEDIYNFHKNIFQFMWDHL